MTQIIDGTTSEFIQSDDAWERHKRIMTLRNEAEGTFITLGEELYHFQRDEQYKTLGHPTFESYLADPEVDINRSIASKLIAIHQRYILLLTLSPVKLLTSGYTKLDIMRPYMTPDNVEEWVDKAATLSRSDLRKEVKEAFRHVDTPPLPEGRYRCLVIDPPWPMKKIARTVRPNQDKMDYPTMTIEEITELDIPSLMVEDGCHVYLWVTHKYLPDGLSLFRAWGIRYQCLMTWVKNVGITPFSWMYDTEHVLFGRSGSLQLEQLGLRLSFSAPVTRHSEKPDIFYERVLTASPGPRLEMFARKPRGGFDVWGNEVK